MHSIGLHEAKSLHLDVQPNGPKWIVLALSSSPSSAIIFRYSASLPSHAFFTNDAGDCRRVRAPRGRSWTFVANAQESFEASLDIACQDDSRIRLVRHLDIARNGSMDWSADQFAGPGAAKNGGGMTRLGARSRIL